MIEREAYVNRSGIVSYVPSDKGMNPSSSINDIQQGDVDNFWPINFHKRGWSWSIYSIKCPMAWEITNGRGSIFIGAYEAFDYPVKLRTSEPDMEHFIQFVEYPIQSWQKTKGDGANPSLSFRAGHGQATMSSAIAAINNGYPLVGPCPNCTGFYFGGNELPDMMVNVDIDYAIGNGIKVPHIVYECVGDLHDDLALLLNGIVA